MKANKNDYLDLCKKSLARVTIFICNNLYSVWNEMKKFQHLYLAMYSNNRNKSFEQFHLKSSFFKNGTVNKSKMTHLTKYLD